MLAGCLKGIVAMDKGIVHLVWLAMRAILHYLRRIVDAQGCLKSAQTVQTLAVGVDAAAEGK